MSLHLIHGPPNTGRTAAVEQAFRDRIGRNPILVVPGIDDIFGWERRLTREDGALVGGTVMHFRDLCGEIIAVSGADRLELAGDLLRLQLVEEAILGSNRSIADRLSTQPGIAQAVLDLFDDFRAELIDPATLEVRIDGAVPTRLRWLAPAYRSYMELLEGRGLSDGPNEAERARGLITRSWERRPVFIAGFDDMTKQQFEMVSRLAVDADAEVTVALSYEPGNPSLELSNGLMADLVDLKEATSFSQEATGRDDRETPHARALLELEARFLRQPSAGSDPIPATDRVTVMHSSGVRNEAEAVAAEVARLVAAGTPPEEIALAVSAPAVNGPVLRDVLTRYGIPVALESETAVRDTTTGSVILAMLRSVRPGAAPEPAFEWLRSPAGPEAGIVDQLELDSLVASDGTAEAVMERLKRSGKDLPDGWTELRSALGDRQPVNEIVARLAGELAKAILAADPAMPPSPATLIETQAATAVARAARELASIENRSRSGAEEIEAAIDSGAVKLWSVPASGTVRIASPYSLRAKRFSCLFMVSQQESGIQDMDSSGPFLSATDRSLLGMSERTDPEVQARYLFYSCLTVPTEKLWISSRTSDEAGKAEQPSALVAAVEELFAGDENGRALVSRGGRTGSDIVFPPALAPSVREAARSIAASGSSAGIDLGEFGPRIDSWLGEARLLESSTRRLDSLGDVVVRELALDTVFSPTELEAYAGCPYRWFIESRLSPVQFGPDNDNLTMGSLLHGVLEELYQGFPGQVPRPDTLDAWLEAVPPTVEEVAAKRSIGLDGTDPVSTGKRLRAGGLVSGHLRREAARPQPRHLPEEIEYSFGTSRSSNEAVPVDGWSLKGKVDRIDLSPDRGDESPREAVVIDFKSGGVAQLGHSKSEESRRLQLQLYLHAARAAGRIPVAGLYVSLRPEGPTSRGAYSARVKDEMLARGASKDDVLPGDQVEGGDDPSGGIDRFIAEGLERAGECVENMRAGLLDHDPATCPNHFDHPAVPNRPGPEDPDEQKGSSSWS
jgi:RecB family exonuclease